MRRHEIGHLRWADFEGDLEWVTIHGKGDRIRHLPVHPECAAFLRPQRWPVEYVFPGRLGGHITLTTINNWVDHMGVQAGLGHIHPHQLRHTAGGKINDETEDIYVAQTWLGHVQVETTMVYTRMRNERLKNAMNKLDWRNEAA
jgi:integrase/recombinase XerC